MEQTFPSVYDKKQVCSRSYPHFMARMFIRVMTSARTVIWVKYKTLIKVSFLKFIWYYVIFRNFHLNCEAYLSEIVPNMKYLTYVNELGNANFFHNSHRLQDVTFQNATAWIFSAVKTLDLTVRVINFEVLVAFCRTIRWEWGAKIILLGCITIVGWVGLGL